MWGCAYGVQLARVFLAARFSISIYLFIHSRACSTGGIRAPSPPSRARRAMGPTPESGGATQALAVIRAAAGDLALAYAWTVVCFKAWDDALER